MVCSHKMAKKEKRSDRKCNEIQRPEYIIEVQKVEIRMYRKVIGVLNNGAAVALLLGKSMKKNAKRQCRKAENNSRQSRDC